MLTTLDYKNNLWNCVGDFANGRSYKVWKALSMLKLPFFMIKVVSNLWISDNTKWFIVIIMFSKKIHWMGCFTVGTEAFALDMDH